MIFRSQVSWRMESPKQGDRSTQWLELIKGNTDFI